MVVIVTATGGARYLKLWFRVSTYIRRCIPIEISRCHIHKVIKRFVIPPHWFNMDWRVAKNRFVIRQIVSRAGE